MIKQLWGRRTLFLLIAMFLAVGCGSTALPKSSQGTVMTPTGASLTPIPTLARSEAGIVSASGVAVPAVWAKLSFRRSGQVQTLLVKEGDVVTSGQVLARLDKTDAELSLARAEASLAVAKAELNQVLAGAREEEIKAAQAEVNAAEAALQALQAELAEVEARPTQLELDLAKLAVDRAKNILWGEQAKRDAAAGNPRSSQAEIDAAKAAVGRAEAEVRIAEVEYEQTKAGLATVASKRARVDEARHDVEKAKAALALLQAGASPEEVAIAEARVAEAEAAVALAKAMLADCELHAPFSGTIVQVAVRQAEWVNAGSPVITMGDLSRLRVETTDLDEINIAKVKIGQEARVTFDALPGRQLNGRVSNIIPMGARGEDGTKYTVIIELNAQEPDLRWGMTALVEIFIAP